MMTDIAAGFALVFEPYVLMVIFLASVFGLFVGSIPGLTATMAVALLVPITFFMDPVPAITALVATTAMAIFAGDIPGALLRIPGTPASAAYADESFKMTQQGKGGVALGAALVFSAIGGIVGSAVLATSSPFLAEFALKFSSFEYFWLALLGLSCAVVVSQGSRVKGFVSLLIGLFLAVVGIDVVAGHPRYTFGVTELMGGISFIPVLIGMFAVSEVLRNVVSVDETRKAPPAQIGPVFKGMGALIRRYKGNAARGSILGVVVGALPGAGADLAAWISYAISKKLSKEPEKFGTGHVEGIVAAGAANNAGLSGAWVPALVFGIPGDSITAVVIGVLYMKGMNPGPTVFIEQAPLVYAVFIAFFLANFLILPMGWAAIKSSKYVLRVPRRILLPIILVFCMVGSFAINNTVFGIGIMLALGILAYLMEENDFPVAPAILGLVLGPMLEENFMTSMIKADGHIASFFDRPIAATLGVTAILVWIVPLILGVVRRSRSAAPSQGDRAGGESTNTAAIATNTSATGEKP